MGYGPAGRVRRQRLHHGRRAPGYFDELLARIRDIRWSERIFWQKVLDIYATNIDYDPSADASQRTGRHTAAVDLAPRRCQPNEQD